MPSLLLKFDRIKFIDLSEKLRLLRFGNILSTIDGAFAGLTNETGFVSTTEMPMVSPIGLSWFEYK